MQHPLINALEKVFLEQADAQKASWQEAYMRNQFSFFGISKPMRALVEKEIFKLNALASQEELIQVIKLLWAKDKREFQYTACRLACYYKKLWKPDMVTLFEYMIRTKSWWTLLMIVLQIL